MSTAPGSIGSHLNGVVNARAARFSFGMRIIVPHNYNDPEQRGRTVLNQPDGDYVGYAWDQIVPIVCYFSCEFKFFF